MHPRTRRPVSGAAAAMINHGGDELSADVVVYDASSAGVMAAVAAARHGASVLLLCASWPACFDEGGRQVGGMSSSGLGVTDLCKFTVAGGLALEFYQRNRRKYPQDPPTDPAVLAELWGHESVRDVQRRMVECQLPAHHCNVTWHLEPHVTRCV